MVARAPQKKLIFTDLDGTLLDHSTYSHYAAQPALDRLADAGVPCLINSSKTADEVIPLHRHLGLDAPVAVENGSAIGIPPQSAGGWTGSTQRDEASGWHWAVLGRPRLEILHILSELRCTSKARFRGFSELGLKQIEALTGLSREAAFLAARRNFSEPLLWEDSPEALQRFSAMAADRGLHAIQGGRFVQVIGAGVDKGRALKWCAASYAVESVQTVALGDAPNDGAMLAAADIAVWVRSPVHPAGPEQGRHHTLHTKAVGPSGWAEAIHKILDQQETAHG